MEILKKINFLLFLFLITIPVTSQELGQRKSIIGKIIIDSLDVENIVVYNRSTNVYAVTDYNGFFYMDAKPNDTLICKALNIESTSYQLSNEDFLKEYITIRLSMKITVFKEITLSPLSLTGNLSVDTKKIKVITPQMVGINLSSISFDTDMRYSKAIVSTNANHFSPLTGIDFIKIFSGLTTLLSGKSKEERKKIHEKKVADKLNDRYELLRMKTFETKSFAQNVNEHFSDTYLIETLQIQKEDLPYFLDYASLPAKETSNYLKTENQMLFIDYLIAKSKTFSAVKEKK